MKNQFETLPENLIQRILEFFQTKRIIKINEILSEYDLNLIINKRRKNLINGIGIKTDLNTIINFSMVCKRFNDVIRRSDVGNLILSVYYYSNQIDLEDKLEHISYCSNNDCRNICHYVNKDIKHSNILKKIMINEFNYRKKTDHIEDLAKIFKIYLTNKQIESYYKIKKNANKLNKTSEFNELIN
jgi:hypothetical protein